MVMRARAPLIVVMEECFLQSDITMKESKNTEDSHGSVTFTPPLYIQRYSKALEVLAHVKPKKIADFGCAECKFIQLLKREQYVEEISGIDIDRSILEDSIRKIDPLTTDYITPRTRPLTLKLLHGSVLTYTEGLKGYDAVTCIELIEHLLPHQLPLLTKNIFSFIRPRLVFISTPNVEFNVLFSNSSILRHWDHKFEWTRDEFESWCCDICSRYGYSVDFDGVGEDPLGTRHLGFCSQIAVFIRNRFPFETSMMDETNTACSYKTIALSKHPYKTEQEKREDDIITNLRYYISIIVFACQSALEAHNDNLQEFYQKNAWNRINSQLEGDWYTSSKSNFPIITPQVDYKSEEGQFSDSENDDLLTKNSKLVNTYGQETYSAIVSPWKREAFLQKLLDKCLMISDSWPAHAQFENAFELIPNKSVRSHLIVDLSQYSDELSCCVKISNKSLPFDIDTHQHIALNVSDNVLHIPAEFLLELHQFKALKCDSTDLKDVVKKRCPEGIFLTESGSFFEVDMNFEEINDNYDMGYSDRSSDQLDTSNEFVHLSQPNESFTEENWDLDSAYNDEKSLDSNDQIQSN